ncbi:MAG: SPOR domain-containing protein [Saprospiraceae bacterium]
MNINKLLTWLLVALIAGLMVVAGLEVWKNRESRKRQQAEEETMRKAMQDYGMIPRDTLDAERNSSFSEADSMGIETGGANSEINYSAPTQPAPASATPAPQPAPAATPAPKSAETSAQTSANREFDMDTDRRDGRYRVSAGSFTKIAGARRRLEEVIRLGYHEAEIGRYNRGKYAVVIVKRTDNLNEAIRIVDKLERKGIDANVIDRKRRK